MSWLFDAIACGLLSSLTWSGLVWMSPSSPVPMAEGWLQGIGITAITNMLLWLLLSGLKPGFLLWLIFFFVCNVLVGILLNSSVCKHINIPNVWALGIHPGAIAVMNVLLGGAMGAI
jgi:hypothetical protein